MKEQKLLSSAWYSFSIESYRQVFQTVDKPLVVNNRDTLLDLSSCYTPMFFIIATLNKDKIQIILKQIIWPFCVYRLCCYKLNILIDHPKYAAYKTKTKCSWKCCELNTKTVVTSMRHSAQLTYFNRPTNHILKHVKFGLSIFHYNRNNYSLSQIKL